MRFNYEDKRSRYAMAIAMKEKLGENGGMDTKSLARSFARYGITPHEIGWVALNYPKTFEVEALFGRVVVRLV